MLRRFCAQSKRDKQLEIFVSHDDESDDAMREESKHSGERSQDKSPPTPRVSLMMPLISSFDTESISLRLRPKSGS